MRPNTRRGGLPHQEHPTAEHSTPQDTTALGEQHVDLCGSNPPQGQGRGYRRKEPATTVACLFALVLPPSPFAVGSDLRVLLHDANERESWQHVRPYPQRTLLNWKSSGGFHGCGALGRAALFTRPQGCITPEVAGLGASRLRHLLGVRVRARSKPCAAGLTSRLRAGLLSALLVCCSVPSHLVNR